jgi:gliding motility-associated-like protein
MNFNKIYITLIIIWFAQTLLYSQHQADNWFLGQWAGINFTTGDPVPFLVNQPPLSGFSEGAVISDSIGNILFYTNGQVIWNRNNVVMQNGDNLLPDITAQTQPVVAFPKPGTSNQYYVFTNSKGDFPDGIYYSIIDMTLDGGLGGVTSNKNIKLLASGNAAEKLSVLKMNSGDGYWLITRLFNDDRYATFTIDLNGVNQNPLYSSTGIERGFYGIYGYMKLSLNKKFLVAGYNYGGSPGLPGPYASFEICSFDIVTGHVGFLYLLNKYYPQFGFYLKPYGCEFSPDSKFLYLTFTSYDSVVFLNQYDMQYVSDSSAFINSAVQISDNCGWSLQLSNDGRIYSSIPASDVVNFEYSMGIIKKPWEKGINCDYDPDGIYLLGRKPEWHSCNILLDYLYRFEWKADDYCQGSPVHFLPHFIPIPDSVKWSFGEFATGSSSTELSPTYTFKYPGIHEVSVDIWYPTGRFEHTSREVEIFPTPHPDLGSDLLICEGTQDTLYANCNADYYTWNGNPGISHYIVDDTGTFIVTATFLETGCSGSDTIHVGFYPPVTIDESSLVITPTTCNGASGSITGLYALGSMPFTYRWYDLSEVYYGSDIDVFGLPAGQFQLTITDGNSCETISNVYTIEDAGNLQVPDVELTPPHCGRPDGQIVVHAYSPSGSVLQYSIDDGEMYQADSVFSGLTGAGYVIRVTDDNGCVGVYAANPVVLVDIPGPQVTQVNITNEIDFLGNGAVEIIANCSTPFIFYSIDGGLIYQSNNGTFENLISGIYYVVIKDENDCDTTFVVEIQNIILTYLHAVTDSGGHCLGTTAIVPIEVYNFNSVANFRLKLGYNADNLQCEGYLNADPLLQTNLTGWVDQASGEIIFQWQDTVPVSLAEPDTVVELVFTATQSGLGELGWFTGTTDSYFTNISGSSIPAEFQAGAVEIYETPEILLSPSKTLCEGQMLSLMSIASGGHPPIDYRWIFPSGDTIISDPFFFSITQADAGDYTLLATDFMHCTDQKTIHIYVSKNPVAAFHGIDTLEMHVGDVLDAGAGMASYSWNAGDTIEYTIINNEGIYEVEMESLFGCLGRDSIYIKLTSDEIPSNNIFIPNAFSPDGDGLNDIFMATATSDYIQKFHMLIFDRWGGQIFESNDIMLGWDGRLHGKLCPGDMYTYKITYSISPSLGDYSEQVRLGTVMLVR